MSQPPAYTRFKDYSNYQATHQLPGPALAGSDLDADFDRIKATLDAVLTNLAAVQRDDGDLHNGIVTPESLSSAVAIMIAGWTVKGAWVTATAYAVKDYVTNGGNGYVCLVAHTGGTFSTDLAAGKWAIVQTAGPTGPAGADGADGATGATGPAGADGALNAWATGDIKSTMSDTLPSGWLWCNAKTIGNGSSGATARANADTSALFTLLWNGTSNTDCPVSGGRGASAAADFAANKTIGLPDMRGRVMAGHDVLHNTAASRLTYSSAGDVPGNTLGASGGEQTHALSVAEIPAHQHHLDMGAIAPGIYTSRGTFGDGTGANTSNLTELEGGGGAHRNVQPTIVVNVMIRL